MTGPKTLPQIPNKELAPARGCLIGALLAAAFWAFLALVTLLIVWLT